MTGILLVDDHAVVRAGYRHLLQNEGGYNDVLEAESPQQAFAMIQNALPDLLICDISMPEPVGLAFVQRVMDRWPQARVLMFTMHNSVELARACFAAGAAGYVTKSSRPEVLLRAIAEVLGGRSYTSPDLAKTMAMSRLKDNRGGLEQLSAREFEVLCLLVSGLDAEKIGELLFLSSKTVQNTHYQIKKKLNVNNDIELTKLAIAMGLTSAEPSSATPPV